MISLLVIHFAAFFLGAVPVGYLLARAKGLDILSLGSGSTGATNIGRTLGKKAGAITLLLDIVKGMLAVCLGFLTPLFLPSTTNSFAITYFGPSLGLCAIFGHCFSPFLAFRGGKGVATSLGVFLLLSPLSTLIALTTFIIFFSWKRYVSLASIAAATALPLSTFILNREPNHLPLLFVSVFASSIVIYRHRTNIERLLSGTETQFAFKNAAGTAST